MLNVETWTLDELREAQKILSAEIGKYSEDQPRDSDGKWSGGGDLRATDATLERDRPTVDSWHAQMRDEIATRQVHQAFIEHEKLEARAASLEHQLHVNGGFTDPKPKSGFVVGIKGRGQIISGYASRAELREFMVRNPGSVGGWHSDGKTYLDVVSNVQSREDAIAMGQRNDQISIWDVTAGAEIQTGGTGAVKSATLVKYAPEEFKLEWHADEGDDNGPCPGCQDAEDGGPYINPYDVPDPAEVCFSMNGVGKNAGECNCTVSVNDDEDEMDAVDFDPGDYDVDKSARLTKGGAGSGDFGHSGREGERGGSGPGGGKIVGSRRAARIAEGKLTPSKVQVTDGKGGIRDYELKPTTNLSNVNAWISPKGEFYAVYVDEHGKPAMDMDHTNVADYLGDKTGGEILDRQGWIHMSDSIGIQFNADRTPTDAQAKVMDKFFANWQKKEPQGGFGTNADYKSYYQDWMNIEGNMKAASLTKGGAGSGDFGHSGRIGEVGGSGDGGGMPRNPYPQSGVGEKEFKGNHLEMYKGGVNGPVHTAVLHNLKAMGVTPESIDSNYRNILDRAENGGRPLNADGTRGASLWRPGMLSGEMTQEKMNTLGKNWYQIEHDHIQSIAEKPQYGGKYSVLKIAGATSVMSALVPWVGYPAEAKGEDGIVRPNIGADGKPIAIYYNLNRTERLMSLQETNPRITFDARGSNGKVDAAAAKILDEYSAAHGGEKTFNFNDLPTKVAAYAVNSGGMHSQAEVGLGVLRGEIRVSDALDGNKQRDFVMNLVEPKATGYNTIDRLMTSAGSSPDSMRVSGDRKVASAINGRETTWKEDPKGPAMPMMYKDQVQTKAGNMGAYPVFAQVVADIAKERGWDANQVQSMIWTEWQVEHPDDSI